MDDFAINFSIFAVMGSLFSRESSQNSDFAFNLARSSFSGKSVEIVLAQAITLNISLWASPSGRFLLSCAMSSR